MSFYSALAFWSLSALKRMVADKIPVPPHPIAQIHETQSQSTKKVKDDPVQAMTIDATQMIDTDWYQETTESLNFFIYLIAMVPPADRNGLATSNT